MREFKGYQKGINLGGWYSQCDYSKDRFDNFITEDDFKNFSTWGIDHVRVPIDYNLVEEDDGTYKQSGFDYIQNVIDLCEKYKLNLVLDLHKTYGYSFDVGENEKGFFDNEVFQERFYKLWEKLATTYGKYHDRMCFELLNEVTDKEYSDKWNEISTICIKRIRAICPDIYILLGGYWNNSVESLIDLAMPYDDKVVYNFHCYEPIIFTHQGAYWFENMPTNYRVSYPEKLEVYKKTQDDNKINCVDIYKNPNIVYAGPELFEDLFGRAIKLAEERNVALYCGEYGVINLADCESTLKWFKDINQVFTKYHIGRAAWSYKEMDFGLADSHMAPVFEEVKKYL